MIPRKVSLVITTVDNDSAKVEIVTDNSMEDITDEDIENTPCLKLAYAMLEAAITFFETETSNEIQNSTLQ